MPRRRRRRRLAATAHVTAVAVLALLVQACTAGPGAGPSVSTPATTPASTVIVSPPPAGTTIQQAPTTAVTSVNGTAPAVVQLNWLDGRSAEPGVVIAVADGSTRWQGPTPGEYAVLHEDRYRWFGADGSMVGCLDGRCVGIDAAGYTAVVSKPGGERLVYEPDATFVGRFDKDGRRIAGGGPAMSEAMDATGVDVAGLVDEGGRPVPFAGGVTGDPHLITIGGDRYTSQLTGEFHARAGDPDRPIMLRFEPMPHRKDVSVVSAAAVGAAGVPVEFTATGELTIGGEPVLAQPGFRQTQVPGGPEVGVWRSATDRVTRLAVVWADGGTVSMSADPALGLTVVTQLPARAGVSGAFGTGEGSADLRDRRALPADSASALGSWQLASQDDTLFQSRVPAVAGFPSETAEVPAAAAGDAERACAAAGIRSTDDRDACAFDVALTGDDGFTAGHADLATVAERPPYPPGLAARWPALAAGDTATSLPLPSDGAVVATLTAGSHLVYRLPVGATGEVAMQHATDCVDPTAQPGAGVAAARVFDSRNRPVSARFALCGRSTTPPLIPGNYVLVIDGPDRAGLTVPVDVGVDLP
jgi:hypothetical protein